MTFAVCGRFPPRKTISANATLAPPDLPCYNCPSVYGRQKEQEVPELRVIVGSRQSALAMIQTRLVVGELERQNPGVEFEILPMTTRGDKLLEIPLPQIGDQGLFVKELERALSEGRIDLAVHSLKDLPTSTPEGLAISAVTAREVAQDVLVSRRGLTLDRLPSGARLGTSSLRRSAQMLHYRPDLQIVNLRGNVDTRLRKAQTEEYDAIVLAAAGLLRLGRASAITEYIPLEICLPAPGQGALAVETRADDEKVLALLGGVNHRPTQLAVLAERAFQARLGAGCQVPAAAYARVEGEQLAVDGMVADADGRRLVRIRLEGPAEQAEQIGVVLAEEILSRGGRAILGEVRV